MEYRNERKRFMNSTKATPVLDLSEALNRAGNDMELLEELFHMLLDQFQDHFNAMEEHYATGNADGVRRSAHTIKGASGNLAAKKIMEAAYVLEMIGKEDRLNEYNEHKPTLLAAFDEFKNLIVSDEWKNL